MKSILNFKLLVGMMLCFTLTTPMLAQETAEEWLEQAEAAEADGRTEDAANAYSGAAHEQMKSGDYEAAGDNYKKAAEKHRKGGREAQANADAKNAGNAYEKAAEEAAADGDHARAAELYEKAAEQYDAAGLTDDAFKMRGNAKHERTYAVSFTATGTGQTTGHIANISVTNNSDVTISIVPQTFYIPSDGKYQSYVGRIPEGITVPPNGTTDVPVSGVCTDVNTAPVPSGTSMPPLDDWIPVGDPYDVISIDTVPQVPEELNPPPSAGPPSAGFPIIIITNDHQPKFTPDAIPGITGSPGYKPVRPDSDNDIIATWPGTDIPVDGTFDPGKDPESFARVVVDMVHRVEDAAEVIQESGDFPTPFTPDPPREIQSFIQQQVWIFCAIVTGSKYDKEDFAENVYDQFTTNAGVPVATLPKERKDELEAGIDDFWSAFQATGIEAKVLKNNGAGQLQVFPGLEKDKVKDNLKKQGDQVEGQTGENPQQAPGADSPTPGSTVQEEEEEDADCVCESLTFTVATDFGGLPINSSNQAVYEFNASKSSPKKVVIEVDEDDFSQKMTIIVSDIKVTCNCEDAECEYYSGKPSADTKGKVTISDVKATGATAPKDGQVISGNGISVDATPLKTSANYFITFKVSATCMLEDCGEDVCIRYISIEIKPKKK